MHIHMSLKRALVIQHRKRNVRLARVITLAIARRNAVHALIRC